MSQFRTVLRIQRSEFRAVHFVVALVIAAFACAAGYSLIDTWMTPPKDVATVKLRATLPPGQVAVEVGFWIALLLSNFLSFRSLELFLRSKVVRMFRDLPVEPSAVFAARLVALSKESLLLATVGACAFIPIALHAPLVGISAAGTLVLGVFCSSLVAIGTVLYVGTEFGHTSGGDAYGGVGAAFLFAPTVGFAASAATCLISKLAFGELLRHGETSNAFWVAVLAVIAMAAFALKSAHRQFCAGYHDMAAAFEEANNTVFDIDTEYQTSAYPGAGFTYRKFGALARAVQIQYRRRHPIARLFERFWIVAAALFLYFKGTALPSASVVLLLLFPYGLGANPWARGVLLPGDRFIPPTSRGVAPAVFLEFAPHLLLTAAALTLALFFRDAVTPNLAVLITAAVAAVGAATCWVAKRPLLARSAPRVIVIATVALGFVHPSATITFAAAALIVGIFLPYSEWVRT